VARILVIDEDALIRANLRRLLLLEGHEVREAAGGQRGVQLALDDPPDLVLCDLVMPDLDGYEVMRRLRADPRTSDVPFVAVTGSAAPAEVQRGFRLGADGYVTKPFEIDYLLGVVARVLATRHAPRGS
jgi:CheY-like chemotaxis protein